MSVTTNYSRTLGDTIRELRESAGLGLRALARKAGVSPSYLSEVESGLYEPSASKAQKIAKALKVKLEKLLPPAE
jgi:transcriptional regulator with XRE-family HTH domain